MSKILIESNPEFKKEKIVDHNDWLNISEMFSDTIQGEGISTGKPSTFMRLQNCTLKCVWCFHENTEVVTKHSSPVKIKNLKKGDTLLTLDEHKNIVETVVQEVLVSETKIDNLLGFRFITEVGSGPIVCTKEHPFYVKNRGWVKAEDLKVGDVILGPTSKQLSSYKMSVNNNQKNQIYLKKRKDTQRTMREQGLIKPYSRTDGHRKLMSDLKTGDRNPMKNPETAKLNAMSHYYKKSALEQLYDDFFSSIEMPISFIGVTNKKAIGDKTKRYRFPDFIVNDTKKLIEIYDTTFEYQSTVIDGVVHRSKRGEQWKQTTLEHYSHFGYEVLFLTEQDLKDKKLLQEVLFNYVYNGDTILEIQRSFTNKQRARLFGSKDVDSCQVYNLSCSPYNTYLLSNKYHNKLVHNCDTLSVWKHGNPYTFDEIFSLLVENDMIEKFKGGQHLILTGGSPLLQQDKLTTFLDMFVVKFGFTPYIEVENECMIEPSFDLIKHVDQWNNSPKLSNSGMKKTLRWKPLTIATMSNLKNSTFKFVVSNMDDWNEIQQDFLSPGLINLDQVILMPCGENREELNRTRDFAADLACKHNVMYSDRLHVVIWDKKTGV